MRLGGPARYLTEVQSRPELIEALAWAEQNQQQIIMIGDGSNIVWSDGGFNGLVIVNRIIGFELTGQVENIGYFAIGAGENWDQVVAKTVEMGYSGIEQLSLIPGTAGATPVQNVGAYGREIADVLLTIEVYDLQTKQFVTLRASDCSFGYRTSRFKTTDKGRFLITGISMRLTKENPKPPFYQTLQAYLTEHAVTEYTPKIIREAVIEIRKAKLPDPTVVANNGSFFANPTIDQNQFVQFLADNPEAKYWHLDDGNIKVSAAWLIEAAGFTSATDPETGMSIWPTQSLVLVNENAKSSADLLKFKQKIVDTIQQRFGITLIQEPELLGS
jgi:UDP-N-acetylmuramate dehydrogenase